MAGELKCRLGVYELSSLEKDSLDQRMTKNTLLRVDIEMLMHSLFDAFHGYSMALISYVFLFY